jgi:acetyl-CoA carboxylase biotin carboxyl carrier protein
MTNQEIKELLKIFDESGIAEMEVQRGENRLRLRRALTTQELELPAAAPAPAHAHGSPSAAPSTATSATQPKASGADPNHTLIKSPIVGTYYDAPSPEAAPFVNIGDAVEPGQILCIIESMKLMNEIEAEMAGTLVHKLVENGRPVEYGEALFAIRPK